jgi:uncharacterized protein YndB with AHSA1/START domain
MMQYNTFVTIRQPVEKVFEFITKIENSSQWGDAVVDAWQVTDGPLGVGSMVTERVKMGPIISELTWEITAFEPNHLCAFEGTSELGKSVTTYIVDAVDNGTRLTVDVKVRLSGWSRLIRPVIQYSHKKNRRDSLAAIKKILEQESGSDGTG